MKKFIAVLTVLSIIAVATPAFAKMVERTCYTCNGSGKCQKCYGKGWLPVWNWRRKDNGKKVRVPPYRKSCNACYIAVIDGFPVRGKCKKCKGTGKTKHYY